MTLFASLYDAQDVISASPAMIIENLRANNNMAIDDHSGKGFYVEYVVELVRGAKRYTCVVSKVTSTCLNPLTIEDDGRVHINRDSCGGIVDPIRWGSLEEACDQYSSIGEIDQLYKV